MNNRLRKRLGAVYRQGNELTGGALGTIGRALEGFNQADAAHVAAALAYYTMFSLFPLLLALIAAGSFFLERETVSREVVRIVREVIPISEQLIESNIERVLRRRGTVGLLGLIGLLWSGTGVFTVLVNHINRAWTEAERRGFLKQRLMGLVIGLTGVLAALLLLSLISAPALNVLPRLEIPFLGRIAIFDTPVWTLIASGIPPSVSFLLLLSLYRWVPNTDVRWSEAAWGALFVALTWEGAKRVFAWYVSSGLVRYQLVYGSLAAVVALLLWIYLSSWLVLFGAHLSAAIADSRAQR